MLRLRYIRIPKSHSLYYLIFCSICFLSWFIYKMYMWWVIMDGKIFGRKFVVARQHVCITGGSEGIGLDVALSFLNHSVKVITIISRSSNKIEHALETILFAAQKFNRENLVVQGFHGDVTNYTFIQYLFTYLESSENDSSSVENFFVKGYYINDKTVKIIPPTQAKVDILVNSAGVCISDHFHNMTPEELNYQINVNVLGTLYPSQQIMKAAYSDASLNPNFKKHKAQSSRVIVIISSQAGQANLYGFVAYGASKFALRGAWEALEMEGYPVGVRTICVFPPSTDTPGFVEENRRKPIITKNLEETSSLISSHDVAEKIVHGVRNVNCHQIHFGTIGTLVEANTHGFSPYSSVLEYWSRWLRFPSSLLLTVYWNYSWKKEIRKHSHNTQDLLRSSDTSLWLKQKKEN